MSGPDGARGGRRSLRMPQVRLPWLRGRLGGTQSGLLLLAIAVGAGAGVGAIAFRYLILWFTLLFTGHRDFSSAGRSANPLVPGLGMWFLLVAPVIGGLIYGPLVDRFAKEARGHGVPEVMYAVSEHGGRIRPQVAVVKSLASALCIGSGGSVGREGPIVQIGSALGSSLGQAMKLPTSRLRLLVACGAAGGISATFNAPIAGVFFALELILRDFETESFGAVVLASVVADVIGRAAFGPNAFLTLPPFRISSYWDYPMYVGLGIVAGVVGVTFVKVLYGTEDVCDRVWRGRPEWLRPAAGGILLGLLLLALPQMYGVGYPVLEAAIRGRYALDFLMILLAGKILATSLTIGIGGSGGVFAPSLFMGAMLGSAYGMLMGHLAPGVAGSAGAFGIVGMGAVFAGAARAPITAVLIIFELTGEYRIILPLMAAVVLATVISGVLSGDTIYTAKLRRRGVDVTRDRSARLLEGMRVGDVMRPSAEPLPCDLPVDRIVARLREDGIDALPVADADGGYLGVVTLRGIEEQIRDGLTGATAEALAEQVPTAAPDEGLEDALGKLLQGTNPGLVVVSGDHSQVIGWLDQRDVVRAYHERVQPPPPPSRTDPSSYRWAPPTDGAPRRTWFRMHLKRSRRPRTRSA